MQRLLRLRLGGLLALRLRAAGLGLGTLELLLRGRLLRG